MKKTSDFGRGFVYNLVLFAEHFGRMNEYLKICETLEKVDIVKKDKKGTVVLPKPLNFTKQDRLSLWASMWFNGASDHFYEIVIPKQWEKKKIGKKAKELIDFALSIGHGSRMMDKTVNFKDVEKAVSLTKELSILIDKELGVKPILAKYGS